MKGRSQRMPAAAAAAADPPDDWGDGSWTVDCSCGVTFDDGEEMVSCDECGVWVHTRCSRFVKGAASFACHNCKASAAEEETEVARLLVELPTKADTCPPPPPPPPRRPPFRLWAQVPLEDRVHVQGPPGGDPALFAGLSSVFSSDLWRCTGYVPQKFGFRYREFPCWDEEEKEKEKEEEEADADADADADAGENPASRGADVLFSLSKEISPYAPAAVGALAGYGRAHGDKVSSSVRSMRSGKKERNRLRAFGVTSGKRKKDELGEGKDRSAKKKARSDADRAPTADSKRRGSVPLIDVNKTDFREDEHHQIAESVIPNLRSRDNREDMSSVPNSATYTEGTYDGDKNKDLPDVNTSFEGLPDQGLRQKSLFETPMKVEKVDQIEPSRAMVSSKTDSPSSRVGNDVAKESLTKEVSKVVHVLKQPKEESHFAKDPNESSCSVVFVSDKSKPAISDVGNGSPAAFDNAMLPDSNCAIFLCSKSDNTDVKVERGDDQSSRNLNFLSCPVTDGRLSDSDHLLYNRQRSISQLSESLQDPKSINALPSGQLKSEDVNIQSEVSYQHSDTITGEKPSRIDVPKQLGLQVDESSGSSTKQRGPLELSYNSKELDDLMKKESQIQSHSGYNIKKLVLGAGKAPASSAPVISRSLVSGIYKSPGTMASSAAAGKTIHLIKQQQVKVTACPVSETDSMAPNTSAEESTQETSRQIAKGHQKGSICSGSKTSQTSSDSKEPQLCPSSKAPTIDDTIAVLDSREMSGSSQTQIASIQSNAMSSNSSQKSEKIHQPIPQAGSKVFNSSMPTHLTASVTATAALSDEELALLLHQELNSSPRVPRVPRMRQAAGMQSAPPTASLLSKRSSGHGGKDQASALKRKNKEGTSRESFRSSRELNDETRRTAKVSSSIDQKHKSDSLTKEVETSGLSSSDATGPSILSRRSSPRDAPNDIGGRIPRTLPGLIDEIMSRDRHITYEQLCDAVRPHWNDLRKPNGERYAYPSHLHAVHDCLRNRSEWSHLIDQCPKNNSSKKRRKFDTDAPIIESEIEKGKNLRSTEAEDKNVDSHREDFPKGKRKARKRRRLELRGRGVKEARKRRNQDVASDDDPAAFSNSSNEGNENHFSDEDSQGTGPYAVGTDLSSSSSDDAG